jgi:hypothetical protein
MKQIRKSDIKHNYSYADVYFIMGYFYKSDGNKVIKSNPIKVHSRSVDTYIKKEENAYVNLVFSCNYEYILSYISFNGSKKPECVILISDNIKESIIDKVKHVHNLSFGEDINIKVVNCYNIFNKYFSKHNIEVENNNYSNSYQNTPIIQNRYISKSGESFYINHRLSYNFELQTFAERLSYVLTQTAIFYNNFENYKDILKKLINYDTRVSNTLLLESEVLSFVSNYNFYDNDFFRLLNNIDENAFNEFLDEIHNMKSNNVSTTLTVKGMKFNVKDNKVQITIPLVSQFLGPLNSKREHEIAYTWLKKFDKLDKFYGFINKAKVMSL